MSNNLASTTLDNLSRLASKPGVQATLILSKVDGAIIHSTGLTSAAQSLEPDISGTEGPETSPEDNRPRFSGPVNAKDGYSNERDEGIRTAEDVARMVFDFISVAGGLIDGLYKGDEAQLVRLRTRKAEIVIVPDSKYLLVVIHDPLKAS